MEKINFQSKVFVLLMVLVGLLIFNTNVFTQRRKRTLVTKKPASTAKPASSKIPAPKTTRGAGEDDANTDSGLEITVGNSDPTNTGQKLTFDAPFLEKCPKQNPTSEKVTCVGIGGGSDKATPEEVNEIHKTISRIFYGKRFLMVRLSGVTLPNQQDEAKSKGCDYFIQTKYESPFLKGEETSVWEKVAGLTASQLPKAISQIKVATDDTKIDINGKKIVKSESQRQSDADKTGNATQGVMGTAGEILGKINIFKKDKKFEMTFNAYRLDDISKPLVSLQKSNKIEKNSTNDAVANSLYNLMRESTEKMQMIFLNPQGMTETTKGSDSKKKKKDKN